MSFRIFFNQNLRRFSNNIGIFGYEMWMAHSPLNPIFYSGNSGSVLQITTVHTKSLVEGKVIMQGNLIAAAYTLRTYWNQFSPGGICEQE